MALTGDREAQLRNICDQFQLWPRVAVETGTWTGETATAMSAVFESVYTIDLSLKYYEDARELFFGTNVTCIFGDSAIVVPDLATALEEPVFWYLDAHFWDIPADSEWANHRESWASSSPQPLFRELAGIMRRQHADIIVVDDIHAFGSEKNWEQITIPRLEEIVLPAKTYALWDSFAMLKLVVTSA